MKINALCQLLLAVILFGCASSEVTTTLEGATPTPASILSALPNTEYPIDLASSGKAQLKDGIFEEPIAPDSATKTRISLGDLHALGDVNGDQMEDAAVLLIADSGGSGTFTYLALVLNENGSTKPLEAVFLGDRIVVNSLTILPGEVIVSLLTRQLDEPMSADPTTSASLSFKLQDGKLIESP
jgi:hypothetical protein